MRMVCVTWSGVEPVVCIKYSVREKMDGLWMSSCEQIQREKGVANGLIYSFSLHTHTHTYTENET